MLIRVLITVFLLLSTLQAEAVVFRPGIEDSRWDLRASKFACRLSQTIPAFGTAVFEHLAGESVRFTLQPLDRTHFKKGAELVAEANQWQPGIAPRVLGRVKRDVNGFLQVPNKQAEQMLAALYSGMSPTFNTDSWYQSGETLRVGMSGVNFQATYSEYMSCVAGLLPVNYDQVARTAILFPSAQWRLSDASRERLDKIILYVKNDDSVHSIYVDGHSDNMGRRLLNRDLSKKRAEAVTEYLVNHGIDETMVITRFHGERYPVVKNNSRKNRARNRRVTIRLQREQ
ncbi:MAG: OmpA family protein [Marinobacterium sp.]|nr:OmpA family protein [Marinobacterium sp.]